MRYWLMRFENLGLPEAIDLRTAFLFGAIAFLGLLLFTGLAYLQLPKLIRQTTNTLLSDETQEIYQNVVVPYQSWLSWTLILVAVDCFILNLPAPQGIALFEFPLGLLVAINVTFLGFALFKKLFESYLLEVALGNQQKINTELLALARFLCNAVIVLIVIFIFSQVHQINIFGLLASLGIVGVAIAFASQKIIEQILWSVVLYIDRPFTVDDYIHLSDNTIGRVESIGWRSTKIRLSGKNTLVVVPNSELAQTKLENLTRARRVISVVTLTFFRAMSAEEKALTHQLILDSTKDILGIDHHLTQVSFSDKKDAADQPYVQAQLIFYILGAAENSMELRQSLLEIARENLLEQLQDYSIDFSLEEKTFDIAQPMNI